MSSNVLTPFPSVDELISTIQRTGLSTVLVEGTNDKYIYRWIEQKLISSRADILACGGRGQLLEIFRRRSEFSGKTVAFVADQDLFIFDGIPASYQDIIWTIGYSVENDLICDSFVLNLLDEQEQAKFNESLSNLAIWFGFEVEEHFAGREAILSTHINQIIPIASTTLSQEFIQRRGFYNPSYEIIDKINSNPILYVRGKQIFQLLHRFLSHPKRGTNYNEKALYEICTKSIEHPNIIRLINEIDKALNRLTVPVITS